MKIDFYSQNIKINISKREQMNNNEEFTKIFIFLAADYGNLGDVAITYSQKCFLKDVYKGNYEIIEIPCRETYEAIKIIKKIIRPNDIITVTGGGNFSNKYEGFEKRRRAIIKTFKNNEIFLFPQTIEFSNDILGQKSLKKSQETYMKHKKITLMAREKSSYEKMKEAFKNKKILLTPDIVFSLKNKIKIEDNQKRKKIGVCFRDDSEKSLNENLEKNIIENIDRNEIELFNTHIGDENLIYSKRYEILMNFIKKYENLKFVFTDRLHCMIFCYLTNTPCLAIDNANHKIRNTYETWMKDVEFINVIDSKCEDINMNELKKYLDANGKVDISLANNLDNEFEIIRKNMKGDIHDTKKS